MSYTILRFSKQKGNPARAIQAHHEREKEIYKSNPDINLEKSKDNIHLITPSTSYKREVDTRITNAKCRVRKDSTRFVDTLITASPEFFKNNPKETAIEYFTKALEFMKGKIRPDNIFSAVIHMDERTPHLHLCFVPLTEDNRLSAKEILGNRVTLSKWQDEFNEYMQRSYPELERGVSAQLTGRKHIPMSVFKSAYKLKGMQEEIEEALRDIGTFNSKKKSKEALSLIEKWIPKVETFETKINMLSKSLKESEQMQKLLQQELQERENKSDKYLTELIGLRHDAENMRTTLSKVPPEIIEQIEAKKKRRKEYER